MHTLKQYTIFKAATLLLVVTLLTPSALKFAHIFNDHKHDVCTGKLQSHLHEIDLDCDLCKFKLNHQIDFKGFNFELFVAKREHQIIASQYFFLSAYQQLHFSLRGPPRMI